MNLGNGDGWIPAMPEKPVVQRPNEGLLEMQQSEIREENWEELLGIYRGVLQEESCNKLPLECKHNSLVGVNQMGPTTPSFSPIETYNRVAQNFRPTGLVGMTCGEDHVQNLAFAETYNRLLPRSSNTPHLVGMSHRGDNVHHVDPVQMLFSSFNQSARSYVSYLQSTGGSAHQKVDSMAELMGTSNFDAPTMKEDRAACVVDKPSSVGPYSQVEGNWRNHRMDSMMHLKNQILHANQDDGDYNMQQVPASRLSVAYRPSYNLNLPARSVAGESLSVARPLQQGPVTPDQQKLQKNNIFQVPNMAIDESLSKENNKQDNAVLPQQVEISEREHNDHVYDSPGATSAIISTEPKEKEKSDSKNDGEIDLNQTPPQKTPKRRKHRPKVVVEGKLKRTPKPKASENKTPGESSTKKRKYVRKKDIKTDQSSDVTNEIEVSNVESQAKSCKRALNFDLDNGVGKKINGGGFDCQADIEGSKLNLNLDPHDAGQNGQSTPTVKDVGQNINSKQKQTDPYNFIHSVERIPPQELLPVAATAPPTPSKGHTLNIIARNMNVRNANINQSGSQTKNGHVHHDIGGGLALILANTSRQNLNGKGDPKLQNRPQLLEDLMNVGEKQSKREYSHTELTQSLVVSQIWSHGVSETSHFNRESRKPWQNGLESSRTKNVKDKINKCPSSMPSGNRTAEDCSEQNESTGNKRLRADSSKLQTNGGLTNLGSKGRSTFIDLTNETNMIIHPGCINSTDSGHEFQKQVSSYSEQMAHMAPQHFAKSQSSSSLTAAATCHMVIASQRDSQVTKGHETIDAHAHVTIKRQTTGQAPSNTRSRMDKVLQKETIYLQGYGQDSKKVAGSREYKRNIFSIDDITDHMKDLHIGNNGNEIVQEERNALVPYRGDGAVVPFEVFDPIKKRKPRPKVDLDPETNRLWNLLMGQEGSESAEPMDNGKQKYWEEERKVFSGRVDSFIARMHLVQGDRRFSKWKGSVVDSVIGVFLTQNVSDHLSSSAFMSLAAKFPLKPTTIRETCSQSRGNPSTEHKVITSYPDERTSCRYLLREPVIGHSSVISSSMSQYKAENVTSGKNFLINNHSGRKEECMISSQSSSESQSCQASEDIRSSSGSNSEPEDQVTGSSFRKNCDPLNLYEQDGRIAAFQQYQVRETESPFPDNRSSNNDQQSENLVQSQNPEVASGNNKYCYPYTSSLLHYQRPVYPAPNSWQKMVMGIEETEIDLLEFVGIDCASSLTSTHFDTTNGKGIEHAHHNSGQSAESSLTEVIKKHPEQQMNLSTELQSRNGKHFINDSQGGLQETFQQEKSFPKDPIKYAETLSQKPSDNQKLSENIPLKPNEAKTSKISDVQSSKTNTTSNSRKRKVEKEKVEAFNWDTLRNQVQSKAGTKGRSRDTMDSLDYEAIRNADVHEISNTIKERGMNNMLAERMKDFLNRLVKDHGGIDLEWLRDVQPDKAKDYLLSIRGLGLKSVECVRLLTLHHLAFPVDTNVGRIAVRLGWVPLQPLPETLQLHLLELYPVLESIQKYLWPRLCMLDQETLYELHYQLITFGKVFCTKRQPNCNACPMRGECRHFASAFASARLALPGPEERRIVCSDVPTSSSRSCGVAIHPMPLPPAEDSSGRGPEIMRSCEPIIEEPTTPDSSIEVSERDIEDAFYEDPDEIPEIKLNIEEFTSNLQSFIQEKMDCQEGDMTKALVALSPGFASIPMPKLKHVSRLRTEHQVYELPDSHPLLKELDRREPDDPSPYLLAIWTPGETADSVEPPESKCSASRGGPCNTKTCFSCNSTREAQAQTVRGTILIPCRTAMRGSFPLNGTYFQVNEVFADDETSTNPLDVPRSFIWNLPRRTVFFGTSVSTIFKGMSTEDIQYCFWKGFVCVRGFDQKNRAPRPLKARLHLAASKIAKRNE